MGKSLRARVVITLGALTLVLGSAVVAISADTRPRGVIGYAVVDARGKFVGNVLDQFGGAGLNPSVMLRVGTTPVVVSVSRVAFGETYTTLFSPLLYESDNCSGQAFEGRGGMTNDPDALIPTVLLSGTRLFVVTGTPREIDGGSLLDELGQCQPWDYVQLASPIQELADLATEFQAPYSLRVMDQN